MKIFLRKYRALLARMERLRTPPRHPAHLWYAVLTFLAFSAALWQHGNPVYTLAVLLLLLPAAAVVYIPYRYFNILSRMLLNCLIFGAGCLWCMHSLTRDVPIDKTAIETLALWSLTFLVDGRSKSYFYLLFIDLLMVLYAALLPRLHSLYLTVGALFVMLVILYRNRSGYLSGDMLLPTPSGILRRNWHFYLLHLLISALAFWYIFGLMPLSDNQIPGIVPVSFQTERDSRVPPDIRQWFRQGLKLKGAEDGDRISDRAPGSSPAVLSPNAGKPIPAQGATDKSGLSGSGGGAQGKDLVFRVRSPLKLYHLGQLYDEYDGRDWSSSQRLKSSQLRDRSGENITHEVKQSYTVEKWVSPKLYSAYYPFDYQFPLAPRMPRYKTTHYGAELIQEFPPTPFSYTALSLIRLPGKEVDVAPEKGAKDLYWPESLSAWHYLKLPPNKISKRVRLLAAEITAKAKTPYAKAVTLRDWLRTNYKYKLHAEQTPKRREVVDYFLYHLGEGHCEYFAAALTVMARSVGLPARVATGFSPGNFNTLTGNFEVYEYHAHAWSQIYIRGLGWLTFDATPPSAVQSDTTPLGLGKMRDPFGDEWRVVPPEISGATVSYIRTQLLAEQRRKEGDSAALEEALRNVSEAGNTLRKNMKNTNARKPAVNLSKAPPPARFSVAGMLKQLREAGESLRGGIVRGFLFIISSWRNLLLAALALPAAGIGLIALWRLVTFLFWQLRLRILIRSAWNSRGENPERSVRKTTSGVLLLLKLRGYPCAPSSELLEFVHTLPPEYIAPVEAVFELFYVVQYGERTPSPNQAAAAWEQLMLLKRSRSQA